MAATAGVVVAVHRAVARVGALLSLVLLSAFIVQTVRAEDMALPALTGRVIDSAEILSPATEDALSARLEEHEKATTNQIVVVTLPDLMNRPIEDWGLMLGRGWGIGQAGKNNGVILLVAPKERELRIEVGYGLEGDLTDAAAGNIIRDEIVPHFKAGDMEAGITAGIDAIIGTLDKTYAPRPLVSAQEPSKLARAVDEYLPFLIFGFFLFIMVMSSWRRKWDPVNKRYDWYFEPSRGSSGGSGRSSGGGFSGGGGSFGGGGASGKW